MTVRRDEHSEALYRQPGDSAHPKRLSRPRTDGVPDRDVIATAANTDPRADYGSRLNESIIVLAHRVRNRAQERGRRQQTASELLASLDPWLRRLLSIVPDEDYPPGTAVPFGSIRERDYKTKLVDAITYETSIWDPNYIADRRRLGGGKRGRFKAFDAFMLLPADTPVKVAAQQLRVSPRTVITYRAERDRRNGVVRKPRTAGRPQVQKGAQGAARGVNPAPAGRAGDHLSASDRHLSAPASTESSKQEQSNHGADQGESSSQPRGPEPSSSDRPSFTEYLSAPPPHPEAATARNRAERRSERIAAAERGQHLPFSDDELAELLAGIDL